MDTKALPKSVRRIVVLSKDSSGAVVPVTLFEKGNGKKKKGTRLLRPLERAVRRSAHAAATYVESYRDRQAAYPESGVHSGDRLPVSIRFESRSIKLNTIWRTCTITSTRIKAW
jgi:hypothetical protein